MNLRRPRIADAAFLFCCCDADLLRLLELEPGNKTSREGVARIEEACKARDEKLKDEMVRSVEC